MLIHCVRSILSLMNHMNNTSDINWQISLPLTKMACQIWHVLNKAHPMRITSCNHLLKRWNVSASILMKSFTITHHTRRGKLQRLRGQPVTNPKVFEKLSKGFLDVNWMKIGFPGTLSIRMVQWMESQLQVGKTLSSNGRIQTDMKENLMSPKAKGNCLGGLIGRQNGLGAA